ERIEEVRRAEARARSFQPGPNRGFADRPTVMYVQQSLNGLGYEAGPVDGRIGPRTRKAISGFQSDAGLAADGAVSPELLRRLLDGQGEEPAP
ncbi:MAG: peptidoglycan-binding protein, partial [Kiloniellaceae bacterium]